MEPMGYHPIAKMMQEAVAARKKVAVAQGAGDVTLDQGSEVIITVTRVFNNQLLFGQITNENGDRHCRGTDGTDGLPSHS